MLHSYASGSVFGEPAGDEPFSVLLLHGWGHDHHDFDRLMNGALPSGLSALAVDLPGFGATPAPESAWGSKEYALSLAGVMEHMDRQCIVLGHSFGGTVALQLVAHFPDRFAGVVLTGVPMLRKTTATSSPVPYRMVRFLTRRGLVGERRLERARQRYGSSDYRAAQGVMREILVRAVNESSEQVIAQVKVPVELVWGEDDAEVTLERAREAVPLFAQARLTVLNGQGHMTPTESPAALGAAIERLRL